MSEAGVGAPARATVPLRVVLPGLAIAAAVPLAVVLLAEDRLQSVIPSVRLAELPMAASTVGRLLLVTAGCAALAGPLAAWLTRVVPPWLVLLGALLPVGVAYLLAPHVDSVGVLLTQRALAGAGAGALLGASAGLVGAADPDDRRFLAAAWAAALGAAGVARVRVAIADPTANLPQAPRRDWHDLLRPYPWLLVAAAALAVALAAYRIREPGAAREPRRPADWLALLPLAPAAALAALAWTLPRSAGLDAVLSVALLVAAVAGTVAPALLRARSAGTDEPGAAGLATGAVAFVAAGALVATMASVTAPRRSGYLLETIAEVRANLSALAAAGAIGALAAVAGAVAGALLPADRRRSGILAGLVTAAAGAALLLPASDNVTSSLPGILLLAGGCGLALSATLRAAGPLAAAVAGGLAAVALPAGVMATDRLDTWRTVANGGFNESDLPRVLATLRTAAVQAHRWWVALLIVLLLAAAVAVAAVHSDPQAAPGNGADTG